MRAERRSAARRERPGAVPALRALAVANARFWATVAPMLATELRHWDAAARKIPDQRLRGLALGKLSDEAFNAEVAATLATLAPRENRGRAVRAIVALEVLFDYLDGRTEAASDDPLAEGERLFLAFTSAVDVRGAQSGRGANEGLGWAELPDGDYLRALSQQTREDMATLPCAEQVGDVAYAAAERCARAQTRLHAAAMLGSEQLEGWGREHAAGSGLDWREYLGGCASSVLAVHALIAAAADPATTVQEAKRIDRAYLAIGGVITMLDSLVDHRADSEREERGFIDLFSGPKELEQRLGALTREALTRAGEAPHGEHHVMTLAGVAAYYTTHPGAREPGAQEIAAMVRRELSPTIWPTLAVMRGWRIAKRLRRRARSRTGQDGDEEASPLGAPEESQVVE